MTINMAKSNDTKNHATVNVSKRRRKGIITGANSIPKTFQHDACLSI